MVEILREIEFIHNLIGYEPKWIQHLFLDKLSKRIASIEKVAEIPSQSRDRVKYCKATIQALLAIESNLVEWDPSLSVDREHLLQRSLKHYENVIATFVKEFAEIKYGEEDYRTPTTLIIALDAQSILWVKSQALMIIEDYLESIKSLIEYTQVNANLFNKHKSPTLLRLARRAETSFKSILSDLVSLDPDPPVSSAMLYTFRLSLERCNYVINTLACGKTENKTMFAA